MPGAHVLVLLLLLLLASVSSCQAIAASSDKHDIGLYPRTGGSGSRSPPPRKGGTGLLGDIVAQGTRKHGQPNQIGQAHAHQSESSQAAHAHPTHLIQAVHTSRPPHPTLPAHTIHPARTARPAGPTNPAQTVQATHPTQVMHTTHLVQAIQAAGRPVRPAHTRKPAQAAQQTAAGSSRRPPSTMYLQWSKNLRGELAKRPVREEPKRDDAQKAAEQRWKKAMGKTRLPAGTSPRYARDKAYRERHKLKKLAQSLVKGSSDHQEHPPKGGGQGGGGRGPGSPGAAGQAVSRRQPGQLM